MDNIVQQCQDAGYADYQESFMNSVVCPILKKSRMLQEANFSACAELQAAKWAEAQAA